jgi:dipeptidase E
MKLLLTSAGFTNKTIADALPKLAGKPFKDLRLVFIPTAANVETGGKEWLVTDLWNCKKLGFAKIEIVDIAAVPKDIWWPQIEEAGVIMFGGGNSRYLVEQLKNSGLDKLLPDLLKTRVYVGISAGSMVTGKGLSLTSDAVLYYENIGEFKEYAALGFTDISIRPHFNSPDFPMVTEKVLSEMAKKMTEQVYALDDNSAIVVDGDKITVVSEGKWKRFN